MNSSINIKKKFTFQGHNASIYALCKGTTDHSFITGSGDKHIAQWNLQTGEQEKFSARLPSPIFSLLPMYDFNQLWVGTYNGHLHVLDILKREEIHVFHFHTGQVFDIQYSPATNLVYSSGGDGLLNCYNPQALKHIHSQKFSESRIRSIYVLNNRLILAEGTGKTIVINAEDFQVESSFTSHRFGTNCHFADEKAGLLYSAGRDAHINVWDIRNNYHRLQNVAAHNYAIYRLIEIEGYDLLASSSMDKTVKLWNRSDLKIALRINKEKYDGHTFSVNSLLWLKEYNTLVTGGDDRVAMSWELNAQ